MNCDRGEKVSSYFKLEPQTQNKQIKNANGFSAEQMRPRRPDGACYNLSQLHNDLFQIHTKIHLLKCTRTIISSESLISPSDESSGETCQSIYLKTRKQLFNTSMNIPPRKMGIRFFWSVLSWFWAWWHLALIVMKPEIPAFLICILIVTSFGDNDEDIRVLEVMRDCIGIIRL